MLENVACLLLEVASGHICAPMDHGHLLHPVSCAGARRETERREPPLVEVSWMEGDGHDLVHKEGCFGGRGSHCILTPFLGLIHLHGSKRSWASDIAGARLSWCTWLTTVERNIYSHTLKRPPSRCLWCFCITAWGIRLDWAVKAKVKCSQAAFISKGEEYANALFSHWNQVPKMHSPLLLGCAQLDLEWHEVSVGSN